MPIETNRIKARIYYEDTDFGGVVYYANYLRYMEWGRTEFFRERGVSLADRQKNGVAFAVVDVHIQYKMPARYDDLIEVVTSLSEVRNAFLVFDTEIYNQDQQLLIKSRTKVACMSAKGRATRIPAEVLKKVKTEP